MVHSTSVSVSVFSSEVVENSAALGLKKCCAWVKAKLIPFLNGNARVFFVVKCLRKDDDDEEGVNAEAKRRFPPERNIS